MLQFLFLFFLQKWSRSSIWYGTFVYLHRMFNAVKCKYMYDYFSWY